MGAGIECGVSESKRLLPLLAAFDFATRRRESVAERLVGHNRRWIEVDGFLRQGES